MSPYNSGWKLDLMCPPGRIGYFYTHEHSDSVMLDDFEESKKNIMTYKCPILDRTFKIERINEFHLLMNEGLFQGGYNFMYEFLPRKKEEKPAPYKFKEKKTYDKTHIKDG